MPGGSVVRCARWSRKGCAEVLAAPAAPSRYRLPDLSAGDAEAPDPLESYSWQDLRETIYGDRGAP